MKYIKQPVEKWEKRTRDNNIIPFNSSVVKVKCGKWYNFHSKYMPDPEKKNEIPQCNRCPSAQVTTDWQGYVIIMDPERSEIAKRLNVDRPGKYALKVNTR